eukprot:TRINITY_DN1964_c0_g1_i4.p1 TRINITY_DN1964_c0_g1~~TRINITY_DN1964_c0_g1_i4.p1  ORF type:complete len:920 (-),score=248.98 TRINITY_DN1964_c0_g1_i4:115-2874(-)
MIMSYPYNWQNRIALTGIFKDRWALFVLTGAPFDLSTFRWIAWLPTPQYIYGVDTTRNIVFLADNSTISMRSIQNGALISSINAPPMNANAGGGAFSTDSLLLYVHDGYRSISMYTPSDCKYNNCTACFGDGYCGWMVATGTCVFRTTPGAITYNASNPANVCPTLTNSFPTTAINSMPTNITMVGKNFPTNNFDIFCQFQGISGNFTTPATPVSSTLLTCLTPVYPTKESVSVNVILNQVVILGQISFNFYLCQDIVGCGNCTAISTCQFCFDGGCQDQTNQCPSQIPTCPKLIKIYPDQAMMTQNVTVFSTYFNPTLNYECSLNDGQLTFPGIFVNTSAITCLLIFQENQTAEIFNLKVLVNGTNYANESIPLYFTDCLQSTCEQCMTAPCGWCISAQRCVTSNLCQNHDLWISQSSQCLTAGFKLKPDDDRPLNSVTVEIDAPYFPDSSNKVSCDWVSNTSSVSNLARIFNSTVARCDSPLTKEPSTWTLTISCCNGMVLYGQGMPFDIVECSGTTCQECQTQSRCAWCNSTCTLASVCSSPTSPDCIITTSSELPADHVTPENLMLYEIIVPVVGGVLVIAAIFIIVILVRRRNSRKRRMTQDMTNIEMSPPTYGPIPNTDSSQSYPSKGSSGSGSNSFIGRGGYSSFDPTRVTVKGEIKIEDISFERKIGQGAFGEVWYAKWRQTPVAVKRMKTDSMTQDELERFAAEGKLMANMRVHPNVLLCLGITLSPMCIIMEYMEKGSLLDFLRKNPTHPAEILSKIVKGIALGMLHLHEDKVIHRDLATRNILLTSNLEPKVADFGMSRQIAEDDGGVTSTNVGPLKWMSPEAIEHRTYSAASDVWSFGVTLFEIYEGVPFSGMDALQAATQVAFKGLRLNIPSHMPLQLQQIMKECFQTEPGDRPTFNQICIQLESL